MLVSSPEGLPFGAGLGRREAQKNGCAADDLQRRQPRKFMGRLWFVTGADLGLGVFVVGVVEQLAASLAMCPENPSIAAAGIPIDAALRGEDVVAFAGGFLAFPTAGVLVHFLLPFPNRALGLRGELGLQPGIGGGEFGVLRGLLESKK